MDIAFDTTWCPTCSRQILPKRIQVPITPQPPAAAPAPPPSSPTTTLPKAEQTHTTTRVTRNKTGTIKARTGGGLVHGTGRVKPNGTIKRHSPSSNNATAARKQAAAPVPPPSPTAPAPAIRHKTIIDQTPVPLYCSDECRLADMQSSAGIDINYRPDRHSSPNSQEGTPARAEKEVTEANDSGIGSSVESESSTSSVSHAAAAPEAAPKRKPRTGPIPIGYAALASIYDLPPCPPPPPFIPELKPEPARRPPAEEYTSGLMMAAQRINAALGPKDKKRPSWATPASQLSSAYAQNAYATGYTGLQPGHKVIPGWTDGSNKWRASVYSMARPDEDVSVSAEGPHDRRNSAYRGYVSTPCRSVGVFSTLGELKEGEVAKPERMQRVASQPCTRARSEAEELYSKWDMAFTRRVESRMSLSQQASTSPTGSTHSLSALGSARKPRKEVPILKKGAEGRLLVPDVKLKRADSSMSFERVAVLSRRGSEASVARAPMFRAESTSGSSVTEEDDDAVDLDIKPKRARSPPSAIEGSKSWYENEKTYPMMILPEKQKRIVTRVVDGQEVQEEIEVDVYPERKRLFLFPGTDQP
ncbi:hypothetical protein BDW22DRAFT_1406132 [Trametopsis cervina]|nr:hypothetical protein BDW22DRAFT_1406132 [Trametopsis cervina]